MPDLMPDTSIYQHVGQGNQLDLGRLLATAHAARQLQSQSAITQALQSSRDPQTGQPNLQSAVSGLLNSGAQVGSDDLTSMYHAAGAQTELQQKYFDNMADIATSVLGSGRPITDNILHGLQAQMVERGIPADVAMKFIDSMPPDQKGRQFAVTQLQNLRSGGATPDVVYRPTGPGGALEPETGAALRFGMNAPPEQPQAPGGPTPGPQSSTLPTGTQESYATSAANAAKLQDRAPSIANQRSLLAQMRTELNDAETGGPALSTLRMHVNQTLSGLGLPTLDPENKLTATQLFNKFSYQLQQQQASGWTSEKNLESVFSANPSLALTKFGNSGVLAFLQGNTDTENLVLSQWNKWKAAHGGGPELNGMLRDWLNDTLKPQYGRGFNARPDETPGSGGVRNFDPRILQFQHLGQDEQQQFVNGMSDAEKKSFSRNLNRYKKFNYLQEAQQ